MSDWPLASTATDPADDPSIPLLTDRIYLPAVELDTALPAAPVAVEAPAAPASEADAGDAATPAEPHPPEQDAADLEAESAIEAELDRDLVAASDADFDALLSVEPPPAVIDAAEEVTIVGALEAPPAAPTIEVAPATDAAAAPPAGPPAADEAAFQAQAEALRAAVLQRVAARLPEQVNAAVRDLMQPAIDQAMAKLGEEAEVALRITLQELVEAALRDELQQRTDRSGS